MVQLGALDRGRRAAFLAFRTVAATADNARAASDSAEAIKLAERAYLSAKKHGFSIDHNGMAQYDFTIKNEGKTPATILGGRYGITFGGSVDRAPENGGTFPIAPMFLNPGHPMTEHHNVTPIDPEQLRAVRQGAEEMWLVAHVDYRDQFGKFHRFGYGRRYNRAKSELEFDASQASASLNYDRQLTPEERQTYTKSQQRSQNIRS